MEIKFKIYPDFTDMRIAPWFKIFLYMMVAATTPGAFMLAQTPTLVKNIASGGNSSNPSRLAVHKHFLCFTANDGSGPCFYRTNGTEDTTECLFPADSLGSRIITCGDAGVYFTYPHATGGIELHMYHITQGGPNLVTDLVPGGDPSNPENVIYFEGDVYFTADSHSINSMYYVPGASSVAVTAHKIPVNVRGNSSSASHLIEIGGYLYFSANNGDLGVELHRIKERTVGECDVNKLLGTNTSSNPRAHTAIGDMLFVTAYTINPASSPPLIGEELVIISISTFEIITTVDINPGIDSSSPSDFVPIHDKVFFAATSDSFGRELYASNGTRERTKLLKDIHKNSPSSNPRFLTPLGDQLMFFAEDINGFNLMRLNTAGLTLDSTFDSNDINIARVSLPGIQHQVHPKEVVKVNENLMYFTSQDNMGNITLWQYQADKNSAINIIIPGSPFPDFSKLTLLQTDVNNFLFFKAHGGVDIGYELWKLDLTQVVGLSNPAGDVLFSVHPNPGDGEKLFIKKSSFIKKFYLSLYDDLGNLLISASISTDQNVHSVELPAPLSSGVYYARFTSENTIITRKIVVIK